MKKSLLLVLSLTLMLFFSANVFAQQGNSVKVANNNELTKALENPNVTSIEITQDGFYDAILSSATEGTIIQKDGDGDRDWQCNYVFNTSNICFVDINTVNTAMCNTFYSNPNPGTDTTTFCPDQNSGLWESVSGPGVLTFAHDTADTTNFSVTLPGIYQVKHTWPAVNPNDPPYVGYTNYIFYSVPEITQLYADDTVCGLETDITYEIDLGSQATTTNTVIWTINGDTTAAADFPITVTDPAAPVTFTFDTLDCGAYQIILYVENYLGCGSDRDTLDLYFYDTPVVNAGDDDEVCGLGTYLYPSYSVQCDAGSTPTTEWTKQSGPGDVSFFSVSTDPTVIDSADVTQCGEYVFTYHVVNGLCEDSSSVTVYFYDTPVVDAGADDTICGLRYEFDPSYSIACNGGFDADTSWSQLPNDPTAAFDGDTVIVPQCGTYTFIYTVVNEECTNTDTVEIFFADTPVIVNTSYPATVCGFDSPEFMVYYTVDCSVGYDAAVWTTSSSHATIAAGISTDMWIASTDTCGTFEYYYTVTNGPCVAVDTFEITFYEIPDPSIIGPDTVFTCSTETYDVTDNTCNNFDDYTFSWTITEGLFANTGTQTTGRPVDVTFSKNTFTSMLIVHAELSGLDGCDDKDTLIIHKELPTLAGQVKYWNEFETYMPSPFATDDYYTIPFDYFYVILYRNETPVDTAYVQPRLMEDLNELMSYFDFTLYTWEEEGCENIYSLQIWDGSFTYHTTPPVPSENTILGNNYTYNNWDGVNATDALAIQLMVNGANDINGAPWNYTWVNVNTDVPQYGYYSHSIADVNSTNFVTNGGITALDALTAKYRAVGLLGSYPNNDAGSNNQFNPNFRVTGRMVDVLPDTTWFDVGPFDYDNVDDVPFTHSGTDYMYFSSAIDHKYTSNPVPWGGENNYINLYYEAIGDVNASYVPAGSGLKATPSMELTYEGLLSTNVGSEITIPISIDRDVEVGAITLSFNYRNDLIEVLGTNYNDDDMFINQEDGILNIAWFNTEALELDADATIAQIRVRILKDIPEGTKLFSLNVNTELADANATPIEDINLKSKGVSTSGIINLSELTSSVYPNPSNDVATITYTLPEAGSVKVEVYNNTGVLVQTLVSMTQEAGLQNATFNTSDVQAGVYIYHITVQGETQTFSAVKRMIVVH